MQLINNRSINHGEAIAEVMRDADEIIFAVAFFSDRGADHVLPILKERLKSGARVEAFIGTDFYRTDPAALGKLLDLRKKSGRLKVHVADQRAATFHPKFYIGRRGEDFRSIIGSANLTGGAMSSNDEVSLMVMHAKGDDITRQLLEQVETYRDDRRFQKLGRLLLLQYKARHEAYVKLRKQFEKDARAQTSKTFDLRSIEMLGAAYLADAEWMELLGRRRHNRKQALDVQRKIARLPKSRLSPADVDEFKGLLRKLMPGKGGGHLWGSGSLHRRGSQAYDQPAEMIALFAAAEKAAKLPVGKGYPPIRTAAIDIAGVGVNIATEMLCTFAPETYAVYNSNTASALAAIGITGRPGSYLQSVTPERYAEVCAIISELGAMVGSTDFSDADLFLDWMNRRGFRV